MKFSTIHRNNLFKFDTGILKILEIIFRNSDFKYKWYPVSQWYVIFMYLSKNET